MPICNLCLKSVAKLVDSHIIAKSIHRLSTASDSPTDSKILSTRSDEPPARSPTGVYDQIVCSECERKFQIWEDYALGLFKATFDLSPEEKASHIQLEAPDYAKLKLFCISVLWKAHVSNQKLYRKIDVGKKHQEQLRQMLLNGSPGTWQDYAVKFEMFNSNHAGRGTIITQKSKVGDIKFYCFYMAGYKIHIKCDSRKIAPDAKQDFLTEDMPLYIELVPFEGSDDHKLYMHIISQNQKAFNL